MKNYWLVTLGVILGSTTAIAQTKGELTKRMEQFSNDQVTVWKTFIYPASGQELPMHRHEHDRVVVALTDGLLKIITDKGKSHNLKLEKDKAYYLSKDVPNELHKDINLTNHAIKVMVIELNNKQKKL
ncbi:hypothetical protein TUM19329_08340 [Legionella antarctica]|uniref:Cupin domain protein n=1 Tax=Legionella antarctica TaxID=2708020 RepID=A0A6F8T2M0_9GAMM|nr:hypothetical protein [Legionella antarctica]BCA94473.1 hypothetical protein TUM19329_08340 [Legionella antarctica]